MTTPDMDTKKETIRAELESTRLSFHALLDSVSEEDLKKQSLNPGWTNREVLFHMTLGFIILAALIPTIRLWGRLPKRFSRIFAALLNRSAWFFNWINAIGARGGGRIYRKEKIRNKFDRVYLALLKRLNSLQGEEWNLGMYSPTKWDALFDEYITIESVFYYTMSHFKFHLNQISR